MNEVTAAQTQPLPADIERMQALSQILPTWMTQAGAGPALLAFLASLVVGGALARLVIARRRVAAGRPPALAAAPGRTAATGEPPPRRDPLTGLATRAEFEASLEEAAWRFDHKNGAPLTVLYVGLDDLRAINDGFGVQAGDAVLVEAAERLRALVGSGGFPAGSGGRGSKSGPGGGRVGGGHADAVARVAGEEFAIRLEGDETAGVALATQVCTALARSMQAGGHTLGLTASVGLACYPAHGAWSRLVSHAGAAMRHVRQAGGNGHAVFTAAMAVDLREQALLLQDLRQAVERNEFKLLYQPKVDAASLQITAAEALLRWEHPVRGVVPPAVFIPLAERHGLMGPIGDWVVAESCRQAAA